MDGASHRKTLHGMTLSGKTLHGEPDRRNSSLIFQFQNLMCTQMIVCMIQIEK